MALLRSEASCLPGGLASSALSWSATFKAASSCRHCAECAPPVSQQPTATRIRRIKSTDVRRKDRATGQSKNGEYEVETQ